MQLLIDPQGQVRCLYGEAIDLCALGPVAIRRASHVEPDAAGRWWADLAPVGGPILGPFDKRSDALAAEAGWLDEWLAGPSQAEKVKGRDEVLVESNDRIVVNVYKTINDRELVSLRQK